MSSAAAMRCTMVGHLQRGDGDRSGLPSSYPLLGSILAPSASVRHESLLAATHTVGGGAADPGHAPTSNCSLASSSLNWTTTMRSCTASASKESMSLYRTRKNSCPCPRRRVLKFQSGAPAHV